MKELFPGYYPIENNEFDSLWKKAIFIFDTNVLLNLYRYQSSTSSSLLNVIEKLSKQIWIPHYVALEFQRNRLKVIAEQHNRYSEVEKIITASLKDMKEKLESLHLETRHSHINSNKIIEDMNTAKDSYFSTLKKLEKKSINIHSIDNIREKIDILFNQKIGGPPKDQNELDTIYLEAEKRYSLEIPPGYKDKDKSNDEDNCFIYSGILYKKEYGDFLIWKQILKHVKTTPNKDIIYITDDAKEDWWLKIKGKKVQPRPELIEEIRKESDVNRFHIYNTECFLEYAKKHIDAQITEAEIKEVRDIEKIQNVKFYTSRFFRNVETFAEKAVYNWLINKFEKVERQIGFPDFIVYQDSRKLGFEIKSFRYPTDILDRIEQITYIVSQFIRKENFHEISLIFVTEDPSFNILDQTILTRIKYLIHKRIPQTRGKIRLTIGKLNFSENIEIEPDFQLGEEILL